MSLYFTSLNNQMNMPTYVIVGTDGMTNFFIRQRRQGAAVLVETDIRRIDEVEAGC